MRIASGYLPLWTSIRALFLLEFVENVLLYFLECEVNRFLNAMSIESRYEQTLVLHLSTTDHNQLVIWRKQLLQVDCTSILYMISFSLLKTLYNEIRRVLDIPPCIHFFYYPPAYYLPSFFLHVLHVVNVLELLISSPS